MKPELEFIHATEQDLKLVQDIVYHTIWNVYPNYYPQEVVDLFIQNHNAAHVQKDLEDGRVWLLRANGEFVGTGSLNGGQIGRVYVLPEYQNRGYGSAIMDFLEERASHEHDTAVLDSSLPALGLYMKRGYAVRGCRELSAKEGRQLCYPVMEKRLTQRDDSDGTETE